jgi:hypothetical protein
MSTLSAVGRFSLLAVWMTLPASGLRAAEPVKPFLDVTEAMGLKGNNGGVAAWGDFDSDGWVDVCIGGEIWRNDQVQSERLDAPLRPGRPQATGPHGNPLAGRHS